MNRLSVVSRAGWRRGDAYIQLHYLYENFRSIKGTYGFKRYRLQFFPCLQLLFVRLGGFHHASEDCLLETCRNDNFVGNLVR